MMSTEIKKLLTTYLLTYLGGVFAQSRYVEYVVKYFGTLRTKCCAKSCHGLAGNIGLH